MTISLACATLELDSLGVAKYAAQGSGRAYQTGRETVLELTGLLGQGEFFRYKSSVFPLRNAPPLYIVLRMSVKMSCPPLDWGWDGIQAG